MKMTDEYGRTIIYPKETERLVSDSDIKTQEECEPTVNVQPDNVNHPAHYNVGGMEAIDVIEAFTNNLYGIYATDTANVIKYILRWPRKNGLEDLKKAQWYLNHLIKKVEEAQK